MNFHLSQRSLLNLKDFSPHEILFLLNFAAELKCCKYAANEVQQLKGKNIALFLKNPLRKLSVQLKLPYITKTSMLHISLHPIRIESAW